VKCYHTWHIHDEGRWAALLMFVVGGESCMARECIQVATLFLKEHNKLVYLSHASGISLYLDIRVSRAFFHPWLWSLNLPIPHAWRDSVTWVTLPPPSNPRRPCKEGNRVVWLFSTSYGSIGRWSRGARCCFQIFVWLGSPKIGFGVYSAGLVPRRRLVAGLVIM
jgi:hypothetical protein